MSVANIINKSATSSSSSSSSPPPSPSRKTRPGSESDDSGRPGSGTMVKKTPQDFIFGKVIGEGSYSTVILAKEINTGREFAIKVLEKRHIIREKKTQYVMREKEVFSKLNHPFFVKLYFTFQDTDRLYFGLSYARRGELLDYIHKLSSFDEKCTRFYAAELVLALEHLHSLGIIHRDLKPENILLNEQMHIQITDFGSAKIMKPEDEVPNQKDASGSSSQRRNSFVGTAQYVSPEILTSRSAHYSSDFWALGCIIYQLLSGLPPFRGGHEYQIFQKITKLEYEFPEGFSSTAKDLVEKLLVLEPSERLGSKEQGGFAPLKDHAFFNGIDWEDISKKDPPHLGPYLPASKKEDENLWSQYEAGLDDQQLSRLMIKGTEEETENNENQDDHELSDSERVDLLAKQASENNYHRFIDGCLVLKQGLLDKRKGLFARRRMFLLTEGPRCFYVDPVNMVLKGEIPWSADLRPEAKNFKIFFVHTPNRTYYLEDPAGYALDWCKAFLELRNRYYGKKKT